MTPFFKKGKMDEPGNYRPVSLTFPQSSVSSQHLRFTDSIQIHHGAHENLWDLSSLADCTAHFRIPSAGRLQRATDKSYFEMFIFFSLEISVTSGMPGTGITRTCQHPSCLPQCPVGLRGPWLSPCAELPVTDLQEGENFWNRSSSDYIWKVCSLQRKPLYIC